jgi:hypothetical protein
MSSDPDEESVEGSPVKGQSRVEISSVESKEDAGQKSQK